MHLMSWPSMRPRPDFVKENIKGLAQDRAEKNLTQKKLGSLLCMSDTMLSRYELGRSTPMMKNYNKLAEFFGWQKWEAKS